MLIENGKRLKEGANGNTYVRVAGGREEIRKFEAVREVEKMLLQQFKRKKI